MAKLTPEELKFLEDNGLPIPENTSTDTEDSPAPTATSTLSDEDRSFLEENNLPFPETLNLPIPGNDSLDGTIKPAAPAARGEMRDAFTYDNMYGEVESADGDIIPRPEISLWERVGAMWFDATNPEDRPLTEMQKSRDVYEATIDDYTEAAKSLYEGSTFYSEGEQRVYDRYVPVKDADGNVTEYKYEKVLIPNPTFDFSATNRVIDQAGRNIYQELGGLFTEGAIMGESDFAESRADMDLSGGEAIASTILSIAAPTIPLAKGLKYGGKLIKYGKEGAKTATLTTSGTVLGEALAGAISETVMSSEGDEGMFVKGSRVQETFPLFNEAQSENVAMFVDGLALNGIMDGVLTVLGRGLGYGWGRLASTGKIGNKAALTQAVKDGTILDVLIYLDPEIKSLTPTEVKLRMHSLADKLNDNRIIQLALGDTTAEITADSTNALMMSADAYVRETRSGLKDTLSPEAFEAVVQEEAARMSTSMIGLFRSQMSNPVVAATVDAVPEQIGEFVQTAATAGLGGQTVDQAAQGATEAVVRGADLQASAFDAQADDVIAQTDEILKAQGTVLQDNPVLQDVLGDLTDTSGLFVTNNSEMRQNLTELVSGPVYTEFVRVMDDVDLAYKSLPEAPIDAALLKTKLDTVVAAVNLIDGSGKRASAILNDVFEGFEPKRVGTAIDPLPVAGEATSSAVMETTDEVIERIGKELTFSDLYDLKGRLARVIDSYRDQPDIQSRLIEFRNHITDSADGQMAYVIANAAPEVGDAFRSADAGYKAAKSQFAGSEPVRRLTDAMQEMRKFDNPGSEYPGPLKRNEADQIRAGDQFVDETLADGTGTLMTQLEYMLTNITSPEDLKGPFREMFIANAANSLRDAVASAGDTVGNPADLLAQAFKPVRDQLQALGDVDLLNRVEGAYKQVRDAHAGLGDIVLANQTLVKELAASRQAAYEGVVGALISTPRGPMLSGASGPTASLPTSSAVPTLRSIITSADSENNINQLLSKIAVLPTEAERVMAREALQAVTLDTIGSRIFGTTSTAMKSGTETRKAINIGAISKLTADEASNLFKSINAVYGADSDMGKAITNVIGMMYQTSLPSRLRTSMAGSDTVLNAARDTSIRDSVSSAILITAGYMNPTAAMLRRIASVPIQQAEKLQKEVAAHVLGIIVTDAKAFSELLKATAGGTTPTVIENAKKIALQLVENAAAGGRYEIRVQEEDAFGEEDSGMLDRDMLQLFGGIP